MKAGTPNRFPLGEPRFRYFLYGPGCALLIDPIVGGSIASSPAIPVRTIAASPTFLAMGPVLSSSQSNGAIPAMLTRPRVGNTTTTALVAAGIRMELP